MHNRITINSYRVYSSREQARFIREEAKVLLEKANEFSTTSRRINRRSANKVLVRSLEKTRGLPFSIRKHQALTELSNYISLAKYNKVVGLEASNTDLLSVSHPRSTRMHSMTASAIADSQMRWVLDDPRIKDETVKSLLASAMFSPIDSPEHIYSMTRLENMPQGQVPLEVLLAAANPFAGKNSAAARRARESVQLSDRFERWINMGASLGKRATDGFRVYVAKNDGSTKSLSGELLNQNMFDPNLVDIEMGKGKVATVPTKLGEGLEAFIKSKDTEDGYSPVAAKVPNGAQVLPESSIVISDAPSIYRKDDGSRFPNTAKFTDDKYDIIKFNTPKDAQQAISDGQKRADELDKAQPKLLKKGETDADSGKQMWDLDEPVFGVYQRGKNTPLAFAQSWKDVNNEILLNEPLLDDEEGRKYTRPEPQTADDTTPLLDQADEIFKPTKKKEGKAKKKVSSFPFEVPDRAYELNPNEEYQQQFEFDNPVDIANDQTPEELEDALFTAVEPVSDTEKATGYSPITFTDGREREVPAEAIAAAIREQGGDAEMALAQAYDKIAGNNKNEEALDKSRGVADDKDLEEKNKKADELLKKADKEAKKLKPNADDILEEEIKNPKSKAKKSKKKPLVDSEKLDDLEEEGTEKFVPTLLKGLSEDEIAKFKEDGDYRPYLPKNADLDAPEGAYKLDPTPVDPAKNLVPEALQSEYPEYTVSDLSKDNTAKTLISQLENAITGKGPQGLGFGELDIVDPNSETSGAPAPAEAFRDALQLQGKDTDAIIAKINKKAEKKKPKAKIKTPAGATPSPADMLKEEEDLTDKLEKEGMTRSDAQGAAEAEIRSKYGKSADEAIAELPQEERIKIYEDNEKRIKAEQTPAKPSIEGKDPLKLEDPFKPEDWIEADGPFAELLNSNENFTRLEGLGDLIDINSALSREYKANSDDLKEVTGGDFGDEVEAIDEKDFEGGPAGKVQYALKILNEAGWSARGKYDKLSTTKGKIAALNDAKDILEDALNDLKTDKRETAAVNSILKSIDKEIKKLEKEQATADKEEAEKSFKKIVKYKRVGNRTLLRDGKGVPFRNNKEIIDFLEKNGFEWSKTVERDGIVRQVNAHTAIQDDEEFKAFARELRDLFDLDLQPQPGTPNSPAQEPIDIDAPAVTEIDPVGKGPDPVENLPDKVKAIGEFLKSVLQAIREKRLNGQSFPRNMMTEEEQKIYDSLDGKNIVEQEAIIKDMMDKLGIKYDPTVVIGKSRNQQIFELEQEMDILEELLTQEDMEELEKDRVIKRINEIREEIGRLSPSDDQVPPTSSRPVADKEIDEVVEEVIKEAEAEDEIVPYEGLLARIKKKLIERGEKRFGFEPSLEAVQDALVEIMGEPRKAYDIAGLIRNYQIRRDRQGGARKNPLDLTREEMIKRLMWFKWGQGSYKDASTYIQMAMKEYKKQLKSLSNEDMIAMLELIYDEMSARVAQENEEKQRRNDVAEARAKKRREREDKLLNEGKEGEEEEEDTTSEEDASGRKRLTVEERPEKDGNPGDVSPGGDWVFQERSFGGSGGGWMASDQLHEKYRKYGYDRDKWPEFVEEEPKPGASDPAPTPLPADVKVTVKALVDRRRKIQRKIDKADLDETTTAAKRKALKDELDEITRIIDSLVSGTKPETTSTTPPTTTTTTTTTTATSTSPAQLVLGVTTDQLKPGDVLVDGHFTITNIKRENTKRVNVDGVTQNIPAYRVSGYFPNSVEQSSKLWSDNHMSDVYRGATPPTKGDLPELNQPKAEDYGTEFVWPNQTKVKFGKRTLYAPKNKDLEAKFLEDYAVYDAERLRRMALWDIPKISKENNDVTNSIITPTNTIYIENVPASGVKVGDIAFKKDLTIVGEFFVVTKVVGTKDGMTTLEGHYVGHQTQTKEWRENTTIDVIRGEKNLPAAGDKEPLDRPDKSLPNYYQLEKERKAKIAEADKGYTPNFPGAIAEQRITPLASKPQLPAFYGTAEELLALGDGSAILAALNASENGYVVFDFETIGKNVQDTLNPDAPIQVAAVKYVGGEKVGELNLFINPGEPLGKFYYEDGTQVLKADRLRDSEGNPITDEWLATQPDLKEQLQKLVEFFGPNAILVGQNNSFDINILERFAEKLGIDFKLSGAIDTLGIAKAIQKRAKIGVTLPKDASEGDKVTTSDGSVYEYKVSPFSGNLEWNAPSNKLKDLANRLGIPAGEKDKFHDALFDVEVTEKVLRALLGKMQAGLIAAGGSKKYDGGYSTWLDSREKRKKELADIAIANAKAGEPPSLDELIDIVKGGLDEKISNVDGEEVVLTPKTYTSKIYNDIINTDWVLDPENTDFIENALIEDLILGDFMLGEAGQLYEVIGFADDEFQPADAIKVIRTGIEENDTLDSRSLTPNKREDKGTGFFLKGPLIGGIYRRKENAGKTTPQLRRELKKGENLNPNSIDLVPDVDPTKGKPLNEDQIVNVTGQAVAEIVASSNPKNDDKTVPAKTIKQTVPGLNVDNSVKDQVLDSTKPEKILGPSDAHLSEDKVPLAVGDKVINAKNGRTGKVSVLFAKYKDKYTNYLKVRYDDSGEREPATASSLTFVSRPNFEVKVKGEDTVADVVAKIKDLQGDAPVDGAPNPEELAEKVKAAQEARDNKAKELNLVKTSTAIINKIKENTPLRESTDSSVPSLKTGEPIPVTFAFDNPSEKELSDIDTYKADSKEDIIVFKASPQMVYRKEPIATIKPDGSIIWQNDELKRKNSLELERVLQKFAGPLVNISAMAIMPKPDPIEKEDFGNGTLTGTQESTFDYDTISKFPPTDEQIAIVDAVMEGKNVVVQALAGSGKTATLVLAARRLLRERPDKKLVYIVFNKEAAAEAQGRMPENVDSRTMDSIAVSMIPKWVKDRLKDNAGRIYFGKEGKAKEKRYKELQKIIKENTKNGTAMSVEDKKEYTDILATTRKYIPYGDLVNLFDYYKFEQVTVSIRGTEQNWGAQDLVKEMREVVDKFAISRDDVISEKHFVKIDQKTGKVAAHYDAVPKILIDYANRMWDDVSSDEGWDPLSPNISRVDYSDLLKRWAQTNPQFIDGLNSGATSNSKFVGRKNELFFFDEAQDMNPVIVDLLDKQEGIQKIYVGDSNQAIYAFRGAVDELNNVRNATELYLTRTFRFGAVIAGVANRILTLLKSPKKIIGKPGEDFGKLVDNMEDPDAYIARTNAAIVAGIFDYLAKGKNPGLNLETYYKIDKYIKSARWLMADPLNRYERPIMDDDLAGYETWGQVTAAIYEGKPVGTGAKLINTLMDKTGFSIGEIADKIKRIAPIRGTGFRDDEYVPLTKEEALKEGETVIGNGKNNAGQIQKLSYTIKDGVITFKNTNSYQDFFFFKEDGWVYQNYTQTKTITKEQEDDLVTKINDVRRWILNFKPRIPIDIEFITAHKAKGKQWKRVKLADDFPIPKSADVEIEEGEGGDVLPSDEELRIFYVAATRAEDALDIGENQKWIYDATSPEDEKPVVTPLETMMGMSIKSNPTPITPEEVDNLIIEDQKESDKKASEVAQKIIDLMETGVAPWTKGWSASGLVPTNAATKKSYQGTNLLAIWASMAANNYEDNRYIGKNQAEKLGGSVRKGELPTIISIPKTKNSRLVVKSDGSEEIVSWIRFGLGEVYNISQIENVNFPPLIPKEPIPVSEVETKLLELYKDHPTIKYELMDGGKKRAAFYEAIQDVVVLPLREQFDTPNALIETLFHELAHSTGHSSRIGGKRVTLSDNYQNHYESRGEEELIAELSVALLAAEFGIEIDWGNTANYVKFWLKSFKENPDMITTAMVQAQAAVNYMLGKKPTHDQISKNVLYPNLQEYLDGGSGGLEGTRSTVGFVKTSALQGMNGNTPGNREMVEKYKTSLTEGKGFAIKEFEGKPYNDPIMVIYDNETGMAFVGEGNHRLQAAIELNLPYVPVRVVQGRASEMIADEKTGKSPQQIKNGKEPKFVETTGESAGKPVGEGYIPPEFHPKYVFDEDLLVENDFYKKPEAEPTAVGEGVGSEGLTGEQIAEDGGLRPEPTGINSLTGEFQKGTPNSGDLKDGMTYEIKMTERKFDSGRLNDGRTYGLRNLIISGNTYKNREALKEAGFRYNGKDKNWSKSYLQKAFNVSTLTQDVLDRNTDPELTEDISKFSENSGTRSNTPKNKDISMNPLKVDFFGEQFDLWNDISGEGDNDDALQKGYAELGIDLILDKELVVEREEIDLYVSQILQKYGYGKKIVLLADGEESDDFLGDDPLEKDVNGKPYGTGIEAAVGLANDNLLNENNPLKGSPYPTLLVRNRGTSKISLLHEIAHLMEGGWRTGGIGGHNQTWHHTYLTLLRGEGFQKEADLIVSELGEKEGDTGAISP